MKGNSKRRLRAFLFTLTFVFVAQTGHASTDGRYLIEFPLSSLYNGFSAITTGPDGSFWFASRFADETGHAKIGRMTPTGKLSEFIVPTLGPGITAITVGPDGNIWFTEELAGKIGRIDSSGFVEEFALPGRVVGTYTLLPPSLPPFSRRAPRPANRKPRTRAALRSLLSFGLRET